MILQLDFSSEVPIYQQIRNQIILGIAKGDLAPGEKLPTIRGLADEIGVNAMTVNKAYSLLKNEGYILADRRSGAVVSSCQSASHLPNSTKENLKLLLAQFKLAGCPKDEVLALVSSLYEEMEAIL